jgi:hypothetical protein
MWVCNIETARCDEVLRCLGICHRLPLHSNSVRIICGGVWWEGGYEADG